MRWMLAAVLLIPSFAFAADAEFLLVIRDHRFEPQELVVPAGKKFKLLVDNRDSTPEEFESHALNREKVVPANSRVPVFLGPLAPGRYPFFGEFHEKTAQGTLIVR
ncbi:MAG: cupredoxin domain-containing protein [Betaproteobacteria bacterium]|nr:MAG: cupredoxin domain-containing protein [Betaproteobacteria bacterium]TMH77474.1 MAG: cupredoxin domain-containing protein [Betaproteobacteria bacterium]